MPSQNQPGMTKAPATGELHASGDDKTSGSQKI
jgi:hypothetical protein